MCRLVCTIIWIIDNPDIDAARVSSSLTHWPYDIFVRKCVVSAWLVFFALFYHPEEIRLAMPDPKCTNHERPKTGEISEPLIAKQEQYGKSMKMWTSCMIINSPQGDTRGPYIFRTKTKKEVHTIFRITICSLARSTCRRAATRLLWHYIRRSFLITEECIVSVFFFVIVMLSWKCPWHIDEMWIWMGSRAKSQVNNWLSVLSSSSLSATKSGWVWIKPKDEKRWLSLQRGQLKMFLTEVCTIMANVFHFLAKQFFSILSCWQKAMILLAKLLWVKFSLGTARIFLILPLGWPQTYLFLETQCGQGSTIRARKWMPDALSPDALSLVCSYERLYLSCESGLVCVLIFDRSSAAHQITSETWLANNRNKQVSRWKLHVHTFLLC